MGGGAGTSASAPAVGAGVGALAILAAGYLPLLAFELQHDFAETRAILAYLGGSGSERRVRRPCPDRHRRRPVDRLAGLGPVHRSPAARDRGGDRRRAPWPRSPCWPAGGIGRRAAAWLAGSVAWAIVALALFAPSLAVITPGLPERPLPLVPRPARARAGRRGDRPRRRARDGRGRGCSPGPVPAGRTAAAAGVGTCSSSCPSSRGHPRRRPTAAGAWPTRPRHGRSGRSTADRSRPFALVGIPPFKNTNAMRFPLEHRGATPLPAIGAAGDAGRPSSWSATRCSTRSSAPPAVAPRRMRCWPRRGASGIGLLDRFDAGSRRVDLGLRRRAMTATQAALVDVPRLAGGKSVDASSPRRSIYDVVRIFRSIRARFAGRTSARAPDRRLARPGTYTSAVSVAGAVTAAARSRRARAARRQPPGKCERRPLQTGVRCPRDPNVEGRSGHALEMSMVDPACGSVAARAAAGRRSAAGGRGPREPRRRR